MVANSVAAAGVKHNGGSCDNAFPFQVSCTYVSDSDEQKIENRDSRAKIGLNLLDLGISAGVNEH